jgi:uncharacterized protein YjbI with pentapeptide repeats
MASQNQHPIRCETDKDIEGPGEWIALRCDDAIFVLARRTISLFPDTLLHNIFCSDRNYAYQQMARDFSHPLRPFVLDRPARYVEPLVHYMRTGELVIDPGVAKRGVLLEAQYFCMPKEVLDALHDVTPMFSPATAANADEAACCTRAEIERTLRQSGGESALRFRGMSFKGLNFSRLDLHNANFSLCNLVGCDFSDCDLTRACFAHADLTNANFARSILCNADCREAIFSGANFEAAKCHDSNFSSSVMVGVRAGSCDFSRSSLERCNLSNAELRGTVLHGVNFRHVNLNGVERSGTNLTMGGVLA